jgi:hypothetical protein
MLNKGGMFFHKIYLKKHYKIAFIFKESNIVLY